MNPRSFVMFLIFIGACTGKPSSGVESREVDVAGLVDPLVDAANSRWFFFNSATRPFGMVNLSPDMVINGAWNSGYRYHVDTIRAFSHIHAWQLSGVPVFPTTGPFKGHLGADEYGSAYSHDRESVKPGYHQIFLDTYQINVELTSTTRVGLHRYTFPAGEESHVLIDLSTFLGPSDTDYGAIKFVNNRSLEGYALMGATIRRPKAVKIFFAIEFDRDFDRFAGWKEGELQHDISEISGKKIGGYVSFTTQVNEVRLMKVGISYTSIDAAHQNMKQELPGWDFDRIAAEAFSDWNSWLSRIEVRGGSDKQQRRFYTDLWHALQGRRTVSDVTGSYCDMTGDTMRIGKIPLDRDGKPGYNHYNSDSFWGAQWTINTLWQLVYPRVTEEFIHSMLMMYRDGGLIPRGPSGGNYTYVMTGASSTPFIVGAYHKGIRNFDIEQMYQALKKNHLPGGMMSKAGYEHHSTVGGGLEFYQDRGYIPYPLPNGGKGFHENGSGQTLEYAYQDATLAQMAKSLGKDEDYLYFSRRSKNYQNIWYPEKGWMWIKDIDGHWKEPFDELIYGKGFVESTAAQMTWFVPHDISGLIKLMGGAGEFTDRLNRSFVSAAENDFTSGKSHDKETQEELRRMYINYGNQPSMQTAFLFNHAGSPWLTQYWSRQVIDKVYSDLSPDYGYSGDEDQGLMGSLAVLMKMGLFSMDGGAKQDPVYELGSPIFDEIIIHLDADYYSGKEIIIRLNNQSENNVYIQSAQWNGKPLTNCWIYHREMIKGGELVLQLGSEPNKEWGIGESIPEME